MPISPASRSASQPAPAADDALVEQAAHWIVRLTDDDEAARREARAAFDAWKQADPRHAAAAAEMERLIGSLQGVRAAGNGAAQPARAALEAGRRAASSARGRRSRRAAASLAVALVLALPAWAWLRAYPPGYLLADLHTATGQWQTRVLPDGSRITLDTASAVNFHYDAQRRAIELVQGAILVEVAKDPERPFVVETRDGSMRALGTRFVVDREADATVLSMIQSKVAVQTAHERETHSTHQVQVAANQRVRITADAVSPIEAIDAHSLSDAWAHRQLVANDRPLAEVLDTLSRYRPGRIFYDRAAIGAIHVSAVLPLDDTDRALQLLKTTFPALRIRTLTPWITRVDVDPAPRS